MTLSRALALFAAGPTAPALASQLDATLSPALVAALLDAGALVDLGSATALPCPDARDCERELREDGAGYVAVCGRSPAECAPSRVGAEHVRQLGFDRAAMEAVVARLLGVTHATGGRRAAGHLGTLSRGGRARDVRVSWDGPARTAWLVEKLRGGARPALVVAPAVSIGPELDGIGAPGDHVELLRLDDALVVHDGRLALSGPVATVPAQSKRVPVADDAMPRPRAWSELRIYRIDGHTVSVRVGARHVRRTYADLGLVNEQSRTPTKTWELLMAICEGGGVFDVRAQGASAKQRVSQLRKRLCEVFGLEEDPFEPFRPRVGWRVKFVAREGE